MKLYFTRAGADRLLQQEQILRAKLREVQGQKGPAAEGDTWHDNPIFEDLVRQEHMINGQIKETVELTGQMEVVDTPKNVSTVRIGLGVVLHIDGEEKTYIIGGYGDSNQEANPPIVAYNTPLGAPLIGKTINFETRISLGGKTKTVSIEKIFFPQ